MDWQQIAAIWLLSVALGGLVITLIVLYIFRDAGQHASGERPERAGREYAEARWVRACAGVYERIATLRAAEVLPERPPVIDGAAVAALTRAMMARSDIYRRAALEHAATEDLIWAGAKSCH